MTNPTTYIVQFDVEYLDGTLKGILIPGQTLTCPDRAHADRAVQFYSNVQRTGDFIRAAVTGDRYKVSNVKLHLPAVA